MFIFDWHCSFFILGFKDVLSAIDKRFEFLESQDADECECALEALGQIGSCKLSLCWKIN